MPSPAPAPHHGFNPIELETINQFVPYHPDQAFSSAAELRKQGFPAERVSAILNQAKIRTRATTKYGQQAHHMLFTNPGYEQGTRPAIAHLHAQRFAQAQLPNVADLGCGIGSDSMAFAAAGLDVIAVEHDPVAAAYAAHNLRNFTNTRVLEENIEQLNIPELTDARGRPIESLWLDPARRQIINGTTLRRTRNTEAYSPALSFVFALAQAGTPLGVKLAPSIDHRLIPPHCEAQWVSHNGTVVEVVLWFNTLARPKIRTAALIIGADPLTPRVLSEYTAKTEPATPEIGKLAHYIYEPDGAIIRARLLEQIATELNAHLIDQHIAYLSSEEPAFSPAVKTYRILETLPINRKALKQWVHQKEIGILNIKKRGVDIVPEQLRAQLLPAGKKNKAKNSATLILTRLGTGTNSQKIAIHAEPLSPPEH